jgi:hypothetical protein
MRVPLEPLKKVLGSSKEGRIRIIGIFVRMIGTTIVMIGQLVPMESRKF